LYLGAEKLGVFEYMGPAIRYNFFIFKEKIKKIFTSIRAKRKDITSLLLFKIGDI
jgi:hypothetical protein